MQDNETDGHFSVEHCSEDNSYGERSIPSMAKLIDRLSLNNTLQGLQLMGTWLLDRYFDISAPFSVFINPYPAGTKRQLALCHQYVQYELILLADQLQVLILISLNMVMDISKNERWIILFKKFINLGWF